MSGRRPGYDCVRAVCAVTVVLFHYGTTCEAMGLTGAFHVFVSFTGGTWGELASLTFLVLSGASLSYGYPLERISPISFYKRRWKSLYPRFYLAYGLAALWLLFYFPGYFGAASPASLMLTVLGMDGYFSYRCAGSYILGEWFLGAIVLLYLLYPLLAWSLERRSLRILFSGILLAASILVIRHGWFGIYYAIYGLHNLWLCTFCFWCGMLYQHFSLQFPWFAALAALSGAGVFFTAVFLPLGINSFYTMLAGALGCFCTLVLLGDQLKRFRRFTALCRWVSTQSYALLLVHHVLFQQGLVRLLGRFAPTLSGCMLGLAAAILLARLLNLLYSFLHHTLRHLIKRGYS